MADAKTEKQKVKEITDKLEEGLKELFDSEKYKSYLSTMSKFHSYSVNNTLLIALQKPDAIQNKILVSNRFMLIRPRPATPPQNGGNFTN